MDSPSSGSTPDPRSATVQATVVSPPGAGPQVVYLPQPAPPPRRWLGWLGWMGFLLCGSVVMSMMAKHQEYYSAAEGLVQERYHSRDKTSQDKLAILEVEGVIGAVDQFVKHQIDQIRDDAKVKAVVVRVNSPGGTITGSDYILHHLKKLRADRQLPMVVSMGGMAASGGYYVSMAVGDEPRTIFAEPTTTTGSIGVIIPHYDVSGLMERLSVKDDSVMSHPRKNLLSMTEPMSEEDRGILKAYVDDAFGRFKAIIKEARPGFRDNEAALERLATGEIFTATQAKAEGLVDELGFIEDAIDRAAELAGLDKNKVRVVSYTQQPTLMGLLSAAARVPELSAGSHLRTFLEFQVPQGYYLATLAPLRAERLATVPLVPLQMAPLWQTGPQPSQSPVPLVAP